MRPGQVPDEILQGLESHGAEAAVEVTAAPLLTHGGYHVPVHGAQVLEEVSFLLEHGDTQAAGEGLLPRVDAQVGLQVPAHAELLAAVRAAVLPGAAQVVAGGAAGLAEHLLARAVAVLMLVAPSPPSSWSG